MLILALLGPPPPRVARRGQSRERTRGGPREERRSPGGAQHSARTPHSHGTVSRRDHGQGVGLPRPAAATRRAALQKATLFGAGQHAGCRHTELSPARPEGEGEEKAPFFLCPQSTEGEEGLDKDLILACLISKAPCKRKEPQVRPELGVCACLGHAATWGCSGQAQGPLGSAPWPRGSAATGVSWGSPRPCAQHPACTVPPQCQDTEQSAHPLSRDASFCTSSAAQGSHTLHSFLFSFSSASSPLPWFWCQKPRMKAEQPRGGEGALHGSPRPLPPWPGPRMTPTLQWRTTSAASRTWCTS